MTFAIKCGSSLLSVLLVLLGACGGGTTDAGSQAPTTPTGGLSIVSSVSELSLARGQSRAVPVSVARTGGFSGAVLIVVEGAPAGVDTQLPAGGIPSTATSGSVTLAVATTATPGSYVLTLRATGSGVASAATTVTLIIPTPTLQLAVGVTSVSLRQGDTIRVPITLTRGNGFAGVISFTTTALGNGTVIAVDPAVVADNATTASAVIVASSTATLGTFATTIRASGSGIEAAPIALSVAVTAGPTFQLAVAVESLALDAGTQASVPVLIDRTLGFGAPVSLTSTGAPSGATLTLTPATTAGASSLLQVATLAGTAPGRYVLTANGVAGTLVRTTTITLIVRPAPGTLSMTTSPGVVSLVRGGQARYAVTLQRGGSFTGPVSLSVSGLPANTTAAFAQADVMGTSTELVVSTSATTPAGSSVLTITGTGVGITAQTVSVTLTVTVPSTPGGSNPIIWTFCNPAQIPEWFAVQSGTVGAWSRVLPESGNRFAFTLTDAVGSVVFVWRTASSTQVRQFSATRDELRSTAENWCLDGTDRLQQKTVSGSFAGMNTGQTATAAFGLSRTSRSATTPTFTMSIGDAIRDLVAVRTTGDVADRMILRRDLNPGAGTVIPTLDFASAEAFAPRMSSYVVSNAGSDIVQLFANFSSSNGIGNQYWLEAAATAGRSERAMYGLPSNRLQTGDLHLLNGTATAEGFYRETSLATRELSGGVLPFGPLAQPVSVESLAGSGYAKLRVSGTWQDAYGAELATQFTQTVGGQLIVWVARASRNYFGAANTFSLAMPEFGAAAGFNANLGLRAGTSTSWFVGQYDYNRFARADWSEGERRRSAARTGTITP